MSSHGQPAAPGKPPTAASATDPILRNALRYTISAREYATLHRYVISRSKVLKKRAPSVERHHPPPLPHPLPLLHPPARPPPRLRRCPLPRAQPRTAVALTSPYAPAVGASLAGLALGVYPSKQLRVTVALYVAFRALEFGNLIFKNSTEYLHLRPDGYPAGLKWPSPAKLLTASPTWRVSTGRE
ncbi:hypothetical protein N0V88_001474 [Collariella sp. IMI 366227]|nr:hypothetical protein N0V88_001474 [Collariella sp. IMI 366227]